jgi:hypothetical protein
VARFFPSFQARERATHIWRRRLQTCGSASRTRLATRSGAAGLMRAAPRVPVQAWRPRVSRNDCPVSRRAQRSRDPAGALVCRSSVLRAHLRAGWPAQDVPVLVPLRPAFLRRGSRRPDVPSTTIDDVSALKRGVLLFFLVVIVEYRSRSTGCLVPGRDREILVERDLLSLVHGSRRYVREI